MVAQILARLHPKSLPRFKCVRKSWYALINDPQFVAKHLHSYNEFSSSARILFKHTVAKKRETTKEEVVFSFLDPSNDSEADFDNLDSVVEDLHFPVSMGLNNGGQIIELPSELDGSIDIIGQCDGILCLILYTGHIVLYNPSINDFRILPDESSLQNYESAITRNLRIMYLLALHRVVRKRMVIALFVVLREQKCTQ
ncbi:hypothetical protein DVH24_036546 [Malus domestica]|uniref:F-box domain-containing protein n=2 Tax=Malus TaxID=3749 RepID=A0A498IJ91_MALDO|nr:hypothetical protein DVH24_036546 [Malus domestica]